MKMILILAAVVLAGCAQNGVTGSDRTGRTDASTNSVPGTAPGPANSAPGSGSASPSTGPGMPRH